ncbi:hypothetical protein Ct61P_02385 [Colletotrichum tofieldiae]|nr:hypothetical protein Ct61P_02385 [Colletotrichum tofieldiae]
METASESTREALPTGRYLKNMQPRTAVQGEPRLSKAQGHILAACTAIANPDQWEASIRSKHVLVSNAIKYQCKVLLRQRRQHAGELPAIVAPESLADRGHIWMK